MNKIFGKLLDFAGGGLIKTITNTVEKYFPPSMSDKEKADLNMVINQVANDYQLKLIGLLNEAQQMYQKFTIEMEGSAKDLLAVPILGRLVVFLRGLQRPVWGFGTLYLDYMVFSKRWPAVWVDFEMKMLIIAINLIVLSFLFGERAIKNVAPFLERAFGFQFKNDLK